MSQERLQKYLARAGVASRRASEKLIEAGRIQVNGKVVRELGTSVTPGKDRVEFDAREVHVDVRHVYLMVHKPQQMISAAADPEGRPVVTSLVPEDFGRVYPVGRLDWDSEGLLLLTDDGDLTNLLTHPKHEVPKTYQVKVRGRYAPDDARLERIRHGTRLDDGSRTQPCEVVLDAETGQNTWYVVTIREGKNRQIRRMFESVGILVSRLRRIAMGPLLLGDIRPGDFRRLSDAEVEELYAAAGGKRPRYSASRGRLSHGNRDSKLQMRREASRSTAPSAAHSAPAAPAAADRPAAASHGKRDQTGRRKSSRGTARPTSVESSDGAGKGTRTGGRPAAGKPGDSSDGARKGTRTGGRPASGKPGDSSGGAGKGTRTGGRPASGKPGESSGGAGKGARTGGRPASGKPGGASGGAGKGSRAGGPSAAGKPGGASGGGGKGTRVPGRSGSRKR